MRHISKSLPMREASQVGEARRAAQTMTQALDFSDTKSGQFAIVVTELASNLVKHGGGGEILLRALTQDGAQGVEVLALDRGKGIADVGQSMQDGYSTAGSPGTGLGAVNRLASVFDIYTRVDKGTVILAQLFAGARPAEEYQVGVVCIPFPGERLCGDGWAMAKTETGTKFLMVDGLGHGMYAAQAADQAVALFADQSQRTPGELMHAFHSALHSTRGAAAAVAEIDASMHMVRFSGVGNIAGYVYGGPKERGLASFNGTLGHQLHKVQEVALPWPEHGLLILHSDGLGTRWKLDDYTGLRQRHPALIAGVLYRDFCRQRDDVTVLVAKEAA